jgi:hypothetical protein
MASARRLSNPSVWHFGCSEWCEELSDDMQTLIDSHTFKYDSSKNLYTEAYEIIRGRATLEEWIKHCESDPYGDRFSKNPWLRVKYTYFKFRKSAEEIVKAMVENPKKYPLPMLKYADAYRPVVTSTGDKIIRITLDDINH